MRERLDLINGI